MTPDATVIYPSRGKLLLLTAGGAMFVVLGFFLLRSTDVEERLAGIAGIAFFGLCMLYAIWRLLRPTPALIIHSSGILDNASGLSAGFLRWDEISGIFVASIRNQRFLAISLKDADAFLGRQSGLKAKMMKANVRRLALPLTFRPTPCRYRWKSSFRKSGRNARVFRSCPDLVRENFKSQ